MPLEGGSPQVVADLTGHAFGPNWSPDGAEIAFYSTVTGSSEVLVVSADGGTPEQLTDFPGLDSWPDWSPDGLAIAFISQGPQGVGSRNTWIVSRDSVGMPWSDPVQLTDFGCRCTPVGLPTVRAWYATRRGVGDGRECPGMEMCFCATISR